VCQLSTVLYTPVNRMPSVFIRASAYLAGHGEIGLGLVCSGCRMIAPALTR
jgi:hypothetical protein